MIHIEPLQPDDTLKALELALASVPAKKRSARVEHFANLLRDGILDPRGIFVARDAETLLDVQICIPLAGAAALFWLPNADNDLADLLVRTALDWCGSIGCKIAQALAKPEESALAQPLVRNGFRFMTRLEQWSRDLRELPGISASDLRFEPHRESLAKAFAATIERSYQGTLDCPELDGTRTIDEVVEGHRAQGKFHADCWWLAFDGPHPVGVALLVEMPDEQTWELAYLGIVPEYRRRGLSRTLLLHALHALHGRLATRVVLAVDDRNTPALRLYEKSGFAKLESSDVYLHVF